MDGSGAGADSNGGAGAPTIARSSSMMRWDALSRPASSVGAMEGGGAGSGATGKLIGGGVGTGAGEGVAAAGRRTAMGAAGEGGRMIDSSIRRRGSAVGVVVG
jgi:hypothetical protein